MSGRLLLIVAGVKQCGAMLSRALNVLGLGGQAPIERLALKAALLANQDFLLQDQWERESTCVPTPYY